MMLRSISFLVLAIFSAVHPRSKALSLTPAAVHFGSRARATPYRYHKLLVITREGKDVTKEIELAHPHDVLASLGNPRTVILDARSWDEIERGGGAYLQPRLPTQRWMQVSGCTPDGSPLLKLAAKDMLPDLTAPVLVYCASGKRAAQAQQTLKDIGYEDVLNLGGYKDLDYLKE
jgi:rhodanese-related sulfurtransferase